MFMGHSSPWVNRLEECYDRIIEKLLNLLLAIGLGSRDIQHCARSDQSMKAQAAPYTTFSSLDS